jgi:integrase/recombinase XerD
MGAPQFRSKLKLLAERAGVDRDVYPHQFRHTCARDLVNDGFSILVVQEQLGHEHVATTEHYIGRLMPRDRLRLIHGRSGVEL